MQHRSSEAEVEAEGCDSGTAMTILIGGIGNALSMMIMMVAKFWGFIQESVK